MRKISGCIHLRVTKQGDIEIAPNPDFFVTEEERKTKVNGNEVKL